MPPVRSLLRDLPLRLARLLWKYRGGLIVVCTLLALSLPLVFKKIATVRPTRFPGHADEAAYALTGKSLAAGRGFQINFVSHHFIKYPPEITRRDDHWPPFLPMCMAPCFKILGTEVWVGRLPGIIFGTVGLPLAAAALGFAYSRRTYVALGAGALMFTSVPLYTESLKMLCDVPLAMLYAFFAAALLTAARRPRMHIVAGVLLGAAYYAKGSALVLLPLYPLLAVLVAGPRVLLRRWVWLGPATALLLISPWLIANWRTYGHPLHTTQNFVSGYIGMVDWEVGTYTLYWDRQPPQTSDRWQPQKYPQAYADVVTYNLENIGRALLLGPESTRLDWWALGEWATNPGRALDPTLHRKVTPRRTGMLRYPLSIWDLNDVPSALVGCTAALYVKAFLLVLLPAAAVLWLYRRLVPTPEGTQTQPWFPVGSTLALLVIYGIQAAFLIYLWNYERRFCLLFVPVVAVLALTGVSLALELPLCWCRQWVARWHWVATLVLAVLIGGYVYHYRPQFSAARTRSSWRNYPHVAYAGDTVAMGDYLRQNLPQAVVMARNPWELLYHAAPTNKAVTPPWGTAEEIFRVARYYGCTHYYADGDRPAMARYLGGYHPALQRVPGAQGLYRIDYTFAPGETAPKEERKNSAQ